MAAGVAMGLAAGEPARAQGRDSAPRVRTTTLAALAAYPLFFHTQRVRVQGEVAVEGGVDAQWLSDGTHRVVVVALDAARRGGAGSSNVQVTGPFWDLGRLQPDDTRLGTFDYRGLSRSVLNRDWPAPGELSVIVAESLAPIEAPDEPTLRAIALDPGHYEGKRVTVVGRFRGANLYGDLPVAPRKSKWDFVLQSADAAFWVTGLRPRGRDFDLSPYARVDTGRWLRVAGIVRHDGALQWLEGLEVVLSEPPQEIEEPTAVRVPVVVPPPAVVFSAPIPDDADVSPKTTVRIQFSRDMDAESFKDQVRIAYLAGEADTPPPPPFTWAYRQGARVLEIVFAAPLERFRTVRVELLQGIKAIDGQTLAPWTLRFTVGAM